MEENKKVNEEPTYVIYEIVDHRNGDEPVYFGCCYVEEFTDRVCEHFKSEEKWIEYMMAEEGRENYGINILEYF